MAHDRKQIEQLARTYTEAWCSRDPARVAAHYAPGGMIAINGGDAAGIADVAEAFIAAFPDIEVFMDGLLLREDGVVEYRWTFTGTSAETGKSVRVPGFEEWTIAPDGLIAASRGHYDQAEYALVFPQGSLADGGRDGRRLPIIASGNCGSLVPARDSRTTTAVSCGRRTRKTRRAAEGSVVAIDTTEARERASSVILAPRYQLTKNFGFDPLRAGQRLPGTSS